MRLQINKTTFVITFMLAIGSTYTSFAQTTPPVAPQQPASKNAETAKTLQPTDLTNFDTLSLFKERIKSISGTENDNKPSSQSDESLPSLMLSSIELRRIDEALGLITSKDKSSGQIDPASLPKTAPAFFLNTVLHFSSNSWVIWVNSRKYRNTQKNNGEFEILEVNKDKTSMKWNAIDLDFVSPGWQSKLKPIAGASVTTSVNTEPVVKQTPAPADPNLKSSAGDQPLQTTAPKQETQILQSFYESEAGDILVDKGNNTITFTLRPNQSFVSREMKIVEGFAKSTPLLDEKGQPLQGVAKPK